MIKHVRNVAAAAATSCLLAIPAAQANVIFQASFFESWGFQSQLEEGPSLDFDEEGDFFSFSLFQEDAESYNFQVDGVVLTYAAGVANDPVDSATFFSENGTVLPDVVGIDVTELFLPFIATPFLLGNFYELVIDVDDDDAYVPGVVDALTGGSVFAGTTLEVFFTDFNTLDSAGAPTQGFAEATFGSCGDGFDAFCSAARATLDVGTPTTAVPVPMSVALLGLGLVGLGWRRRK